MASENMLGRGARAVGRWLQGAREAPALAATVARLKATVIDLEAANAKLHRRAQRLEGIEARLVRVRDGYERLVKRQRDMAAASRAGARKRFRMVDDALRAAAYPWGTLMPGTKTPHRDADRNADAHERVAMLAAERDAAKEEVASIMTGWDAVREALGASAGEHAVAAAERLRTTTATALAHAHDMNEKLTDSYASGIVATLRAEEAETAATKLREALASAEERATVAGRHEEQATHEAVEAERELTRLHAIIATAAKAGLSSSRKDHSEALLPLMQEAESYLVAIRAPMVPVVPTLAAAPAALPTPRYRTKTPAITDEEQGR